jgi:hypothetical protein
LNSHNWKDEPKYQADEKHVENGRNCVHQGIDNNLKWQIFMRISAMTVIIEHCPTPLRQKQIVGMGLIFYQIFWITKQIYQTKKIWYPKIFKVNQKKFCQVFWCCRLARFLLKNLTDMYHENMITRHPGWDSPTLKLC